ncbi:acetylglutamate kinase [Thaumasiovibrio subtropicus]|uniref:acetylglutamate kinase n=1 Tax=Thaumasiovibrio subtropicus TaxID=1891207 RepID=UPI000B34E9ED|nr:acetylglutamate kinase [Thaumasiovibrio subtropicus]
MSQQPLVIKLGGAVLSCTETLQQLFDAIANYQKTSVRPLVIVHGGGYLVDELMNKLQLPTVKKEGLRVTPLEQIPYIAGALAGTANKLLQGQAVRSGVKAVGLSLADGGLCNVTQLDEELGAVGEASPGDAELVNVITGQGVVPIISSIGLNAQGELMNVNADQAAVAVASALDADLVLLSDVSGVLDGKGRLMSSLTEEEAAHLIETGVISDGMVVKVHAAFSAAKSLGRAIEVATWRYPEKLAALFEGESIGTRFAV